MGDAKKLIASQSDALAAPIADRISFGSFTLKTESSTPRDRAPCCSTSVWTDAVTLPSAMAAIRRALGTISIKISCRLPSSSGESKLQ
jgi:hypothetical protein